MLSARLGHASQILTEMKDSARRVYLLPELTSGELALLAEARQLVEAQLGTKSIDEKASLNIEVVDFADDGLHGTAKPGLIRVARRSIGAPGGEGVLAVLVHETAHLTAADGRGARDGEKAHVAEIERIWAGIVQQLQAQIDDR